MGGARPLRDLFPAAPHRAPPSDVSSAPPPPQQQQQQQVPQQQFAAPLPSSPAGAGRQSLVSSDCGDWPRMSQVEEAMAAAGALGAPPLRGADDAVGDAGADEEEGAALLPMGTHPVVLGRTSECPPEATLGFGDTQQLVDATAALPSSEGIAVPGRTGSDDSGVMRMAA
jgi:hypothetical protein